MTKSKTTRNQTKKHPKQKVTAAPVIEPLPGADQLVIVAGLDGEKHKWFWTAREGKVEHYACADEFDDQVAAEKAGQKWLAKYAKASDAAKRKLLGWKTSASAPGSSGSSAGATEPDAKPQKKQARTKVSKDDKPKKVSLIAAAFSVLSKSSEPMNCKAMVEQVTTQGLWSSAKGGKTPDATLYSAILRETQKDGKNSRFIKTERGHFTANLVATKEA